MTYVYTLCSVFLTTSMIHILISDLDILIVHFVDKLPVHRRCECFLEPYGLVSCKP